MMRRRARERRRGAPTTQGREVFQFHRKSPSQFRYILRWQVLYSLISQVRHSYEGCGEDRQGREKESHGWFPVENSPNPPPHLLGSKSAWSQRRGSCQEVEAWTVWRCSSCGHAGQWGDIWRGCEKVLDCNYSPLLMVCSQVPEEEANDHNRLAEEVPVQEDWNPECPTGPPTFDTYNILLISWGGHIDNTFITGPTSCKYPEEDQSTQAQGSSLPYMILRQFSSNLTFSGQGSHLPVPQRGKVNKRTFGHRQ